MKKVVITGASGFIGKALTKKLISEGIIVYAIVRDKNKLNDLANSNLKIIESNLDDYGSLHDKIKDEIDVFYHLAWEGTFGESFKDYHLQLKNAAYAGDALIVAINIGSKKFVFAGTIGELEVKRHINMEDCSPRISCIYGNAKMAGEMLCKILAFQNGIDINIAIISNVYGVGDYSKMIQNVLLDKFIKGESPKLINGDNLYDWIYIDDVVEAFKQIGAKGKPSRTYYVGHKELKTFENIVTETRDIVNPKIDLKFGEFKDLTEIDYSLIDLDALYNDTGFECKADFKESILKTAQWVKTLDF